MISLHIFTNGTNLVHIVDPEACLLQHTRSSAPPRGLSDTLSTVCTHYPHYRCTRSTPERSCRIRRSASEYTATPRTSPLRKTRILCTLALWPSISSSGFPCRGHRSCRWCLHRTKRRLRPANMFGRDDTQTAALSCWRRNWAGTTATE